MKEIICQDEIPPLFRYCSIYFIYKNKLLQEGKNYDTIKIGLLCENQNGADKDV